MDFSIIPFVGRSPLVPEDITVVIPPGFEEFSDALVVEVRKLTQIASPAEEEQVKGGLGRVTAVLSQIESARKMAAGPIDATKNAIQEAAASAAAPLQQEKERLGKLLIARAASEEARRAAKIREAYEQQERLVKVQQAEILRLQEERQKAMIAARNAEDLEQAADARREAAKLEEQLGDAEWELSNRQDTVVIPPEFNEPLIQGARTPERIDMEIVDKALLFQAISADTLSSKPLGLSKAVTIELRKQFLKDLIKDMREMHKGDPNFDPIKECLKIGVELKIYRAPIIQKSSRIVKQ
jgi:hypothetical protein